MDFRMVDDVVFFSHSIFCLLFSTLRLCSINCLFHFILFNVAITWKTCHQFSGNLLFSQLFYVLSFCHQYFLSSNIGHKKREENSCKIKPFPNSETIGDSSSLWLKTGYCLVVIGWQN